MFVENKQAIINAVKADLGKHEIEILASEYNMPIVEIDENIAHLSSWMQPRSSSQLSPPHGVRWHSS
jgi:aldehyde dehydrogenase (NAD+)